MAKQTIAELREYKTSPSIAELARMPDYLREFHLAGMGENAPDPAKLDEAVKGAIQDEFEEISGRAVNRFVYFVEAATGPIKIGVASDVRKRLSGLRGSSPVKLKLLLAVKAGRTHELKLHTMFARHRLHGEWFAPHPDIYAEIERLRAYEAGL